MTDLDKVRALVRDLHRELGLDAPPAPTRVATTEYVEIDDGQRTMMVDRDETGRVIRRTPLPKAGRGPIPEHDLDESEGDVIA